MFYLHDCTQKGSASAREGELSLPLPLPMPLPVECQLSGVHAASGDSSVGCNRIVCVIVSTIFFLFFCVHFFFFHPFAGGFATAITRIIITANSRNAPCGFCGRRVPLFPPRSLSRSQAYRVNWTVRYPKQSTSSHMWSTERRAFIFFSFIFALCFMHYD